MIPKNSIELQADINAKMSVAIDKVAKELVEKLITIIDKEVYGVHQPTFYERTYQLRDSWYATAVKIVGSYVESVISQDGLLPTWNANKFQHGNFYESLDDGYNSLNKIIDEGKIGNAFGFPDLGDRPFWQEFIAYCDTNIDRMIKTEMKAVGLYTI